MTPDDDIDSMWMEIRPVRLPPAESVAPVEEYPVLRSNTVYGFLSSSAHHGCQCKGEFTSLEGDLGFRCTCRLTFRIGIADARKTPSGPIWEYFQSAKARETTAMRLTHEPHQILLELERLQA
jgi:hypothetical protein